MVERELTTTSKIQKKKLNYSQWARSSNCEAMSLSAAEDGKIPGDARRFWRSPPIFHINLSMFLVLRFFSAGTSLLAVWRQVAVCVDSIGNMRALTWNGPPLISVAGKWCCVYILNATVSDFQEGEWQEKLYERLQEGLHANDPKPNDTKKQREFKKFLENDDKKRRRT